TRVVLKAPLLLGGSGCRAPLSPGGRGAGGEGEELASSSPSPPTPLPPGERGDRDSHRPGQAMNLKKLGQRYQPTIAQSTQVRAVGFLTGAEVRLHFPPAPADTGVVFLRTDVQPLARIPARLALVTGTHRRTTLGHAPAEVALVEHVLAALAGLRIDNCLVEL